MYLKERIRRLAQQRSDEPWELTLEGSDMVDLCRLAVAATAHDNTDLVVSTRVVSCPDSAQEQLQSYMIDEYSATPLPPQTDVDVPKALTQVRSP